MVFTKSASCDSQTLCSHQSTPSRPSWSSSTSSMHSKKCLVLKAVMMSLVAIAALSSLGLVSLGGVDGARFQLERARNILRGWSCPGGSYATGSRNNCLKCPTGYKCLGGFHPARRCSPGKYQYQQGRQICFPCPQGFYNLLPGLTGCRPASPGSYVAKSGQSKQVVCPKNTYQTKSGQKNCLPCPSGTASGPGATACSKGPDAVCGNNCPKTPKPVCGSDGISYPNKCVLNCTTQSIVCQSNCPCLVTPLPVMEGKKLASKRKCACPRIYAPVCGMDSKTYANPCLAHCREKIVACRGKCPCRFTFPPIKGFHTSRPTRHPTSRPVGGLMLGAKRVGINANLGMKRQENGATWTSKYFYVRQRLSWKHAQDYCARKGSQLAVIHSMKEHRAVADACQGECWLGGDRGSEKDGFGWTDESRIDFENWAPQEPKTGLCMRTNGAPQHKWAGADCERTLPFVCQNDYNFHLNLAMDESAFLDTHFFGKKMLLIWSMVVAVSLIGFAGVLFWHAYYTARKEKVDVVPEKVEEGVSEKTPLISKQESMET